MTRPTKLLIESSALLHNLSQVQRHAPDKKIIAMIKANAYGCGVDNVAPVLDGLVDAFGVACLEEALLLRKLGVRTPCVLFQGIFHDYETHALAQNCCIPVLHHMQQVQWLVGTPLPSPIKVWIKVDTGMHRLGFAVKELPAVINALQGCPWVSKDIGLMTHLACADEPDRIENKQQIDVFKKITSPVFKARSIANSAAIIALPQAHADVVRPGIMLYGVSPLKGHTAPDLQLKPVMQFVSAITAIHSIPANAQVGYQGIWTSQRPSRIGIVAAGYGDGYPRHIAPNTPVWIKSREVPIVGRVSMDTLAVDITDYADIQLGDAVELWGKHLLVERIAHAAGTSPYELLCQTSDRPRR